MVYFSAMLENNVRGIPNFESTTLNELQRIIRNYYSDSSGFPYPGIKMLYRNDEYDGSREPLALEIVNIFDDLIQQEIEEEEYLHGA